MDHGFRDHRVKLRDQVALAGQRACLGRRGVLQPTQRDELVDPADELHVAEVLRRPNDALERVERLVRRPEVAAGVSPSELHLDAPPASSFCLGRRQLDGAVSILRPDEFGGAIESGVCLLDRVLTEGMLGAREVVLDRALRVAGLLEVHVEHRRQLADSVGVELLEGNAHTPVQLAPFLFEQRRVRGVLQEAVAKQVLELGPECSEADEALCLEHVNLRLGGHDSAPITRSSTRTGNCRPMTAATRRLRLASSGNWSILASSNPWRVSGISIEPTRSVATHRLASCTITPRSISMRTTSSTKNGLPSERARIRSRTRSGRDSISRRLATRVRLSASVSGSSRISVSASPKSSRAWPISAQPGESTSARIAATNRIGSCAASGISCRATSIDAGSAQWMSSHTTTTELRPARPRRSRCVAATYRAWRTSGASVLTASPGRNGRPSRLARYGAVSSASARSSPRISTSAASSVARASSSVAANENPRIDRSRSMSRWYGRFGPWGTQCPPNHPV